jgi:hypothetical protein
MKLALVITDNDTDAETRVVATQGDFIDLETHDPGFDLSALTPTLDENGKQVGQLHLKFTWFAFLGWNVAHRTGLTDLPFDVWRYTNTVMPDGEDNPVGEAQGGSPA